MAVVAYTSSLANPIAAQVDKVFDLAVDALPLPNTQLFGDAIDSGDPTPIFTWAWTLLAKPVGSAAALQVATAQNPTVQGLDTWGNYRFMLVATNTDNGNATSEANPLKAPSTAFVTIRVKGAKSQAQKLAKGERNWHAPYGDLVQKVEDLGSSVGPHAIATHTDVANTTGADLDILTGGGYAQKAPALTAYHKHKGAHVDVAGTGAPGVLLLDEAPADVLNPKAITQDRITYSAFVDGTPTAQGYLPGQIGQPTVVVGAVRPLCAWYFNDAQTIHSWAALMCDAGPAAGSYTFELYSGTLAQFKAGTLTALVASGIVVQPAGDNEPGGATVAGPWDILSGRIVAVVCTAAPAARGGQLAVTISARRKV